VKKQLPSLGALAEEILAEVEAEKQAKTAAAEKVAAAPPPTNTELGGLLYKFAAELRAVPPEVTYDDIAAFVKGQAR
jgi:hypothetical protein